MIAPEPPLRLLLDGDALAANWRWLAEASGSASCGAAVKADGYGLGARGVVDRLAAAGCRDFFVATWAEAAALAPWPADLALSVLHGLRDEDVAFALASSARPVLNSPDQVARWRAAGGSACDVMVDTGMNRLGLTADEALSGLLDGLAIETLMSHLACADEPGSAMNPRQLAAFRTLRAAIPAQRYSLANSAGICLGEDYSFDLTRPGLALYGGVPRAEAERHIRQVARPQAAVVQKRLVPLGGSVGYGATFTAERKTSLIILNLGYADGYLRAFSGVGGVLIGGKRRPVAGRVSMDLVAVDAGDAFDDIAEGDWIELEYALPKAAACSGLSQYELLTGLGARYQRRWI